MNGLRLSIRHRTARHSADRSRPRGGRWLLATLLLVALPALSRAQAPPPPAGSPESFNLVFSSRMFMDVHESDAKAAVMAWSEAVTRERHMRLVLEPRVIDGLPALTKALRSGQVDLVTLTTQEYLNLGIDADQDSFIVGLIGGDFLVKYLLLVNKDAGIHDVADLRGRTLLVYENSLTSLAVPWLDTILLDKSLPPAAGHFGKIASVKKLSAAVLPVFFGQSDACLVTSDGLATLNELNPQVGGQVQILAASPGFMPSVSYVRARHAGKWNGIDLFAELKMLHRSAPGQQILNLFKVDKLVAVPASTIAGVRELLATHRRLLARGNPVGGKSHAGRATPRAARGPAAVAAAGGSTE